MPIAARNEWPTADDLRAWMRSERVEESNPEMIDLSFASADELLRYRIDRDEFNYRAEMAGIVTDPTADGFDAAVYGAWCPSYVHHAILIRAASLYVRRDSANGTISFGEFATSVRKMDPDVDDLMRELQRTNLP